MLNAANCGVFSRTIILMSEWEVFPTAILQNWRHLACYTLTLCGWDLHPATRLEARVRGLDDASLSIKNVPPHAKCRQFWKKYLKRFFQNWRYLACYDTLSTLVTPARRSTNRRRRTCARKNATAGARRHYLGTACRI